MVVWNAVRQQFDADRRIVAGEDIGVSRREVWWAVIQSVTIGSVKYFAANTCGSLQFQVIVLEYASRLAWHNQ